MPAQLLSSRYVFALDLVAQLFRDIDRKVSGVPYVTHLYGVSHILCQVTDDEDVHIAGLLHDVIEDISHEVYGPDQLKADFGERIYEMVVTVTHDEARYGKREARERYLQQLQSGAIEACLVSAADLLHNASDVVDSYEQNPALMTERMGGERVELREWFWQERFTILQQRLGKDHQLVQALHGVMQDISAVHAKIR